MADFRFYLNTFAENGNKATIPDLPQADGSLSYDQGYGPDYDLQIGVNPDAKPIERNFFNQAMSDATNNIKCWQTRTYPDYVTAAENGGTPVVYPQGARVRFDIGGGNFRSFESTQPTGTSTVPTDTLNWVQTSETAIIGTTGTRVRDNTALDNRYLVSGTAGTQIRNNSGLDARYLQNVPSGGVGQAQLRTSSGSVGTTATITESTAQFPTFANSSVTLPGGQYGFAPRYSGTPSVSGSFGSGWVTLGSGSASTAMRMGVVVTAQQGTTSFTISATQRYITASPPYNIGHGDIAHFIYLKQDADGKIVSYYLSDTPPWAYNGPTDIRPDAFVDDGFGGVIKKKLVYGKSASDCTHPFDGGDIQEYIAHMGSCKNSAELVVIDNDMKNADMGIIPHPFDVEDGEKVILLDPTSGIVDQLAVLHEVGEDVSKMIIDGFVVIGDEIKDCNKPDGVSVHKLSWKVR